MSDKQDFRVCRCCEGVMRSALVRFTVVKSNSVYVVNDVPAFQCDQCGETAYDGETVSRLERLTSGRIVPKKVVNAWVYYWSDAVQEISKNRVNPSTEIKQFERDAGTSLVKTSQT